MSKKNLFGVLVGLAAYGLSTLAQAIPYDFDVTFDGINATVDASSDPIAGTSLIPGVDSFNLDIHTAGDDFWNVTANQSLSIYASFFVLDSGLRTGNVTTTFLLDGAQVAQDIDLGLGQANVHMGAQVFNLSAGTTFDQVVVDYTFLTSASSFTTIQSRPDVVGFSPFFRAPNIEYVAVPEPATLALFGLGLAGMGFARRKKKSA